MKKLFIISAGLGVTLFGSLVWLAPFSSLPPQLSGKPVTTSLVSAVDSTMLITTGVVGAGGDEPLLARTNGRIQDLFFAEGDYARRGQILVKLHNHTYVTAPRAGFLGPSLTKVGQYIVRSTPVTRLSRHSYLVVTLLLSKKWLGEINIGDSVHVWATIPPARITSGVVGDITQPVAETALLEVILPKRAPFRVGETAYVRLQGRRNQFEVR
jgi:hypothetical protein